MALEKIIKILKKLKEKIKKEYKTEILGVFGSFARGEQKTTSDVDILVEFKTDADLIHYCGLSDYLEKVIGQKVDLVSLKTVRDNIRGYIMQELVAV